MIESPGCSTPFPFEAAIWLWEETEELYGGSLAGLPVSLGGTIVTSMPQAQNVRLGPSSQPHLDLACGAKWNAAATSGHA